MTINGLFAVLVFCIIFPVCTQGQTGESYIVGMEIFGNKQAADVVLEGRRFEQEHVGLATVPDKRLHATELYAQAIELQPGARINAYLALQIAQKRSQYTGLTDLNAATKWYRLAIENTDCRQTIWLTAHCGLACALLLQGNKNEAMQTIRKGYELDVDNLKPPYWQLQREGDGGKPSQKQREEAALHLTLTLTLLNRIAGSREPGTASRVLAEIAQKHPRLPVGRIAHELAMHRCWTQKGTSGNVVKGSFSDSRSFSLKIIAKTGFWIAVIGFFLLLLFRIVCGKKITTCG